jgi:hypothetical protein
MPITAKCLIPAIFRGSQKKQKMPPFLYYIPLNGFAKNTRWRLNKISNTGPADILKARPIE